MKRFVFLLLFMLCGQVYAQKPFDGPYVRYDKGQILVTNIFKDDDLLVPKTEVYKDSLNVMPEGHPEWAFKVRLRDSLANDPSVFPGASKILFMSDIEGEFVNFRKLLLAAGVIDEKYNWTFGKNTLVIPGDLFDRGKDVVPELWLLYKLEDEARAAGACVETQMGNHDQMNLSGDHRYTDAKYFKDAWLLHTDINGLFDKDTELGRWLRTKNVIAKVGDVLTMHGGMSPAILHRNWSLEQLNNLCRPWVDAARKSIPDSLQVLFSKDALFWYRGYFMGQKATMSQVDSTLQKYGCKYIVVGHTIVKWNIASYYGGKVIALDVDEHLNDTQAALYENSKWYKIDATGKKRPLVYRPANDDGSEKDVL